MIGFVAIFTLLFGCFTPSEKKQMRKDMFDMQTRLLQLEGQLNGDKKAVGESTKRLASTNSQLDKINLDLQRIRGELDTLRVGVVTGQLPGTEGIQEGSIAANVADMSTRVEALESSMEEILSAIQKAGIKKKTSKRKSVSGIKSLQAAFDKKQFKYVAEDAPGVLKNTKSSDKDDVLFLYAESLYKLGKLRDAALKYNDLLDSKPEKKYMAKAKLRMGDCFRHLGDKVTAKLYYEELISEFPDAEEAGTAKDRLSDIN